jgi:hypothetical protein
LLVQDARHSEDSAEVPDPRTRTRKEEAVEAALSHIPHLPQPGQLVRWRCRRHADAIGWAWAYGPGPFPVVRLIDRSEHDIPPGVIVRTQLGEREINTVWLVTAWPGGGEGELGYWEGYSEDALAALDG